MNKRSRYENRPRLMGRVDLSRSQPQQLTDVRSLEHLIDVDAVESEIIDRIVELKFPKLSKKVDALENKKTYDYLTNFKIFDLTEENVKKLKINIPYK